MDCLSCLKYPTFKQKVLEVFCFLTGKNAHTSKSHIPTSSLGDLKKNIECLKSLFYKNVKGATSEKKKKNSQENPGNEDLRKEKNLNIK